MTLKLSLLLLPLTVLLAACGPKDNTSTATDSEAPSETQQALQKSWADAKDAAVEGSAAISAEFKEFGNKVGDWSQDQSAKLKGDFQSMEKKMDAQVAEWKTQSASFSAAAKEQWNDGMSEFQEGKDKLAATWDSMSDASADNWDAAKSNLSAAWSEVEQGFAKMKAAATEDDAPTANAPTAQ